MKYFKLTIFAAAMSFAGDLFAQSKAPAQPAATPVQEETFTAKIFTTTGVVKYQKAGADAWLAITAPYLLEAGDKVKTGKRSKAEIYIKYGSKIRLNANTTFVLTKVTKEENSLEVVAGKMQAWIRKVTGHAFSVRTPTAVCAVRGTIFEIEVDKSGQTVLNMFSGGGAGGL